MGKVGGRENSEEGCVIQRGGAGGRDQEVGVEGREPWLDLRSLLKAGSTGFPNGMEAGLERKLGDETERSLA